MKTPLGTFFAMALTMLALVCLPVHPAQAASWATNSPMANARYFHTATLLSNGKVLVAGGYDGANNSLASAELYDPNNETWTGTGSMTEARAVNAATVLTNGQVLVTGGFVFIDGDFFGRLASAELFDPSNGTWATTTSMATARVGHTATLLPSGQVLVAGGYGDSDPLASCELYDPSSGTWASTGDLNIARAFHTATLLFNGLVMVTGGQGTNGNLSSAEIYDPASGTWTVTANPMNAAHMLHTAILLPDGQVLIAGGYDANGAPSSTAELFGPKAGTWTETTTPLNEARAEHIAALLPDGTVLVAGGYDFVEYVNSMSSTEIYNPDTGIWTATNQMKFARGDFTATMLPNGNVLVAGGFNTTYGMLSNTELHGPISAPMNLSGATLLPSGAFQFAFAGNPNSTNLVLTSTDMALPLSDWTALGAATEFCPSLFIFTDAEATNSAVRFYRTFTP